MKRDILWENGLQIHLILKKRRNIVIKIVQKMNLNTHERCFRGKTAKNTSNI